MPSGYYLQDESPITITDFPKGERFESTPNERAVSGMTARRRTGLVHETEEGAFWVFRQSNRRRWRLVYRVNETDLAIFQTLDDAVDGDADAFYFVPDVDASPIVSYLVRKTSDFDPPSIGTPQLVSGVIVMMYDYVLELLEESAAGQILA